jgi:transcriptional regulator with XRE-family HTH domain
LSENKVNKEICVRIAHLFARSGETQEIASKHLGVQRTQFGRIINGKLNPTLQQVCAISSHYNSSVAWIVEGEGSVYKKEKSGALQQPDQILVAQLKREIEVMRASLLRLADLVPSEQEENSGQEVTYDQSPTDKTQSTGKR